MLDAHRQEFMLTDRQHAGGKHVRCIKHNIQRVERSVWPLTLRLVVSHSHNESMTRRGQQLRQLHTSRQQEQLH